MNAARRPGAQRVTARCSPLFSMPALRCRDTPPLPPSRFTVGERKSIRGSSPIVLRPTRGIRFKSSDGMSSSSSAECSVHWERCGARLGNLDCARISLVRNTQDSSLMSVWSTSTGRNSVFGAEGGAVLPSTQLPIHVHVERANLRNVDGHCFHKRFHDCQVAMVEVQLNSDTKVPSEMLIAFAVCTTLLVAVHMLALMISTCILPNIEAVCNLHSISLVHESPHERLHWYIEVAWAFSTLLGLLLFLLEIAILCWVKFYDFSQVAAWSACIVLIPVLIIFLAFAIHFYRSLVAHKYEVTVSGIRELELLKEQIESTDVEGRNGVNLLQTASGREVWSG
ncbi:uncharacterized protein LOC143372019 isoform X2 [Andrena cerasifolii]|uniref:uncharacterized protein LOC143372019 isoform X2 n=1 Tax=Andrena cerasifolii TaxID=2819439 RepID=UPI0040383185